MTKKDCRILPLCVPLFSTPAHAKDYRVKRCIKRKSNEMLLTMHICLLKQASHWCVLQNARTVMRILIKDFGINITR
jgi:hypothetical protein